MPDSAKAVFLSYASQDAVAVRRICETLRASGVEVWFDADGGLEHGDEWDAKIRRQIKECVFFLPVVSANTQARHEGYFRIEWELAAERAMGFAHNAPFILPIVIDDTTEAGALVPDRFRKVQWTRLPGGVVSPDVQARFSKLWQDRTGETRPAFSVARVSRPVNSEPAGQETRATTGNVPPAADDKSIAVLPFANMSADAENEYFSDGITEEIINALVQVPDLRVAARTSVFAFKGKADDLRTIAAKLGVRTVLEGSVRKAGNKIRITAQLINAADGFHLWSEKFDRGLDDIFAVQDEIARTIAEKLKSKLSGSSQQQLVKTTTDDVEAYQLYLQGRHFWSQRGAGLAKGLRCFEAALALDPDYALAHTGVADVYSLLTLYGHARPNDVMPKARAAAERALALEPDLAEARNARAFAGLLYDRDIPTAFAEFRRAIALKPTYITARYWLGNTCCCIGRADEGVTILEETLRIEPLSPIANAVLGWGLLFAARAPEAVPHARRAVELNPALAVGHWVLGLACVASGRGEEGVAELRVAVTLSGGLPLLVATLGCALVCVGRTDEARALLDDLTRRAQSEYVGAFQFASLHAYLGDEPKALEWLERACEENAPELVFLRVDVEPICPMAIPASRLSAAHRAVFVERLGLLRQ